MRNIYMPAGIHISFICLGIFCMYSFPCHGSSLQKQAEGPTITEMKGKTTITSPESNNPSSKYPEKNFKKNLPKEKTKNARPGPPPEGSAMRRGMLVHSEARPKNPIDMSTGKELTPWTDKGKQKTPDAK